MYDEIHFLSSITYYMVHTFLILNICFAAFPLFSVAREGARYTLVYMKALNMLSFSV
jgi:nitrate reductase NapE component